MKCNRCGTDFVGNFCPSCGAPVNQPVQTTGKAKPPARKKGLKTWQIVLITLGCVIGAPIVLLTIVSLVIGIQTAVDVFGESPSSTSYYSALASSDTDTPSYTDSVESDDDTSESSETSSRFVTSIISEKERYMNSCRSISFEELSRNPDKLKGTALTFTGEVIQVTEPVIGDTVTLRIDVTKTEYGFYTDTILATVEVPEGEDRILEDDIITFYGDCEGLYTYTSVLGSKISLPKISIRYYEIQ